MKVERVSENKIKIILTIEELENRDITLKDIEKDADIARELFTDLIEESNVDNILDFEDSQLLIEASSDNNNLLVVTVTKVGDLPDLRDYSLMDIKKIKKRKNSKSDLVYKISSNIYDFNSLDTILELCENAKNEKLFFGKNSLYKKDNKYYLIFSPSTIKNKKFVKTFVFLSEYCDYYYSYNMFPTLIKECATLIIENNAMQKLSKL